MVLRDAANQVVPSSTSYDVGTYAATLTPTSSLAYSSSYTVNLSGATDSSGNVMSPTSWTFQTSAPPPPPIDAGPGGPIALITSDANRSSSYLVEIARAEGLNEFANLKNTNMSATTLAPYDVVVLGDVAITDAQVTALTAWVDAGGNLILLKPDARLLGLAGLTSQTGTVSNGYLAVNGATEPGAGITTETMQFHGTANRYMLSGATSVAALYTTATAATGGPAVSLRSVGTNGGQVAAFAYDLAQSVIQTRQGNPAWAGTNRDGMTPNRSNDLFFGGASADWVNLAKVHIPQADEQQRLLANLITVMARDRMPMPRFWYFPEDLQGSAGRHGRRPRRWRHGRTDEHLRRGKPCGLFGGAVGVRRGSPPTSTRAPPHQQSGDDLQQPGLRDRGPPGERVLQLHVAGEPAVDLHRAVGRLEGHLSQRALADYQPVPLHRVE